MKNFILKILLASILTISCQDFKTASIEVLSTSTSFEYKDTWEAKGGDFREIINSIQKGNDYKNIKKNAYLFNIDLRIKNNTQEKIEEGSIKTVISLDYPSKNVKLSLREIKLYDEISSFWNPEQTLTYSANHFLNTVDNFKPELFDHQPDKVKMNVFIAVKNSVGLYLEKQIIFNEDITTSWNNINR